MCGICGATGVPDQTLLHDMTDILRHRGPDELGFYVDDHVMLGQCRLSIIDLKTGKQPIYNEDETIVVMYNGEIYNFRELRRDLEAKGHRFSTNSDTEVTIHAYEQYGLKSFEMFNGMFALAMYDSKSRRLILARDRQGIKPLYYTRINGQLVFASEIKSILKYPGVRRELDKDALAYFLSLRYVPLTLTMFTGIKKILPGHYVVFDDSGFRETEYWTLQPQPKLESVPDDDLKNVLSRSVERHMISDVPVGVYLSGGIDSASMVAFASKFSDKPLNTFCMGFGEQSDEVQDAKAIADYFGCNHHETIVKENLLEAFPDMIWHMDFPKRNLYPYYLAKLARKHVKVVLSGLGGDELFAGYDFRYRTLVSKRPANAADRVQLYLSTQARDVPPDQDDVYGESIPEGIHHRSQEFLTPFFSNTLPYMEQVLLADFDAKMTYDFLPVDDATSMAHSVETRVPFLDNELVDLAFSMTFSSKFKDGMGKASLRQALASDLPKSVFEKKKQGFGPNPFEVYKRELRNYAEEYLPKGRCVSLGLINPDWIRDALSKGISPELNAEYNKIWDCLALEVFLRLYFSDSAPESSPTWDSI